MMIAILTTTTFYFVTVYTPTFGKRAEALAPGRPARHAAGRRHQLHLESGRRRGCPTGSAASLYCDDRDLSLLTAYPALHWLAAAPTFGKMLAVEMMFSFYFGVYSGTMLGCLVEIVPAHVRTTCFSLAFALAAALFGTFTPFAVDLADPNDRRQGLSRLLADVRCGARHHRSDRRSIAAAGPSRPAKAVAAQST